MNQEKSKLLFVNAINAIRMKGGEGNYLIIELSTDYYLQLACAKDSDEIFCEAVSNNFISLPKHLDTNKQNRLVEIGWEKPVKKKDNYSKTVIIKNDLDVITLVEKMLITASEIYNVAEIKESMFDMELDGPEED